MRRVLGFFGILLFVWFSMLVGLRIILEIIVPFTVPIDGLLGRLLTGVFRVGVSASLTVFWLWIWRRIAYTYFWKRLRMIE